MAHSPAYEFPETINIVPLLSEKALVPIYPALAGIVTSAYELRLLNALFPISVTFSEKIIRESTWIFNFFSLLFSLNLFE